MRPGHFLTADVQVRVRPLYQWHTCIHRHIYIFLFQYYRLVVAMLVFSWALFTLSLFLGAKATVKKKKKLK